MNESSELFLFVIPDQYECLDRTLKSKQLHNGKLEVGNQAPWKINEHHQADFFFIGMWMTKLTLSNYCSSNLPSRAVYNPSMYSTIQDIWITRNRYLDNPEQNGTEWNGTEQNEMSKTIGL